MLKLEITAFSILALFLTCASGQEIIKKEDALPLKDVIVEWNISIDSTADTPECKTYWSDNTLMAVGPVISSKKKGLWKFYYKGTNGRSIMAEVHYKNDVVDGEVKEYYPSGRLQSKIHYKNGVLNGSKMTFYESGIGKYEEYYKDGKKYGKSFEYYENGTTRENAYFKDGMRDGMSMTFYKNGKRKSSGRYSMDKKNGQWEFYSDQGMLEARGHYRNDEKTGTWSFYDTSGVKIDEQKYD